MPDSSSQKATADLAAQEAALAAREAEQAAEQQRFDRQQQLQTENKAPKKGLLRNADPDFVNPKERMYSKIPLTLHQMDILIMVLVGLIVLFLFLGIFHIPFFGLFGG